MANSALCLASIGLGALVLQWALSSLVTLGKKEKNSDLKNKNYFSKNLFLTVVLI